MRKSSNVRVYQLAGGGLLLTHLRHSKRVHTYPNTPAQGEDVEQTIANLEELVASLRSMRDRLEAEA
jgi:hypothetical protein